MFCKKCGKQLKDNARFCSSCGWKVEFVDVQVNNTIDEFELEKRRIEQEKLEAEFREKREAELAKRKEEEKKRLEALNATLKKVTSVFLTIFLILAIAGIILYSVNSFKNEMSNNYLNKNGDDVRFVLNGVLQKNMRIKVDGRVYYLGEDGNAQLYKMVKIGDKLKAQGDDGGYVENKTVRLDGYYYHFGKDGFAIMGDEYDDCYFDEEGKMIVDKWQGECYFGPDGKKKKNTWVDKYYVGEDGKYFTEKWTPDGFYVDRKGEKVVKSRINIDGATYYIDENGKKVVSNWWGNNYFDEEGHMVYNKYTPDGYYVGEDGNKVVNRTAKIGNDIYYFDASGKKPSNTWAGNYYVDENGKIYISRWTPDDYYVDEQGQKVISAQKTIANKNGEVITCYFDALGKMKISAWVGDYYYGEDGNMLKGTTTPDGFEVDENGKYINKINMMQIATVKNFKVSAYSNYCIPQFTSDNPERLKTANDRFMELDSQLFNEVDSYDSNEETIKFEQTASIVRQDHHEMKVKISGTRKNREDSSDRGKLALYFTYDKDNEECTYVIEEN